MRSAGRSDNICPRKSKLVDELLAKAGYAELDPDPVGIDIDGIYTKKPKKRKKSL